MQKQSQIKEKAPAVASYQCTKCKAHPEIDLNLMCFKSGCPKFLEPVCTSCIDQDTHGHYDHFKNLKQMLAHLSKEISDYEQLKTNPELFPLNKEIDSWFVDAAQILRDLSAKIKATGDSLEKIYKKQFSGYETQQSYNAVKKLLGEIVENPKSVEVLTENFKVIKEYVEISEDQSLKIKQRQISVRKVQYQLFQDFKAQVNESIQKITDALALCTSQNNFLMNIKFKSLKGREYFGELSVKGEKEGTGLLLFDNGNYFRGAFKCDIPSSGRVVSVTEGFTYDGPLDQVGLAHGEGSFAYQNGEKIVGQFEHGKKTGKCRISTADGCVIEGHFDQDKLVGDLLEYREEQKGQQISNPLTQPKAISADILYDYKTDNTLIY